MGHRMLESSTGIPYGDLLKDPHGNPLWGFSMGILHGVLYGDPLCALFYGDPSWGSFIGVFYGDPLWRSSVGILYGNPLWRSSTAILWGILHGGPPLG